MTFELPPRTVLLTGSSGFIATHLHSVLLQSGHRVIPIDIQTTPSNPPHADTRRIDINDVEAITSILKHESVDTIIHAAAITHVRHSWEQEKDYEQANVHGTAAVLEAIRRYETTAR
jgi:nucleoside-diphosphate-sugar epimerase